MSRGLVMMPAFGASAASTWRPFDDVPRQQASIAERPGSIERNVMSVLTMRSVAGLAIILMASSAVSAQRPSVRGNTGSKTSTPADGDEDIAAANNILQVDKQSVGIGAMPPEILEYDVRLVALVTETKRALAAHDTERARQFPKLYADLMAERASVYQKFAAASIARNNAIANARGNLRSHPNAGLGQNRRPRPTQGDDGQGWCQQGSGSATPGGYAPC